MKALLYAVVPALGVLRQVSGVQQARVRSVSSSELRLLYSELDPNQALPMPQSAVEFHRVLDTLLQDFDVVPFRFQTWMAIDALTPHVEQNADAYRTALDAIAGCIQMEVVISRAAQSAAAASAPTGREYLQQKARREQDARIAAAVVRENLDPYVQDWQQQATPEGYRLSALVPRAELHRFQQHAHKLNAPGALLRLTGPWPASAFISVQPQVGVEPQVGDKA
ncbi:MAG TPA: GvpL/GvpF family gas vesicle protein [Terriglobales bacterium]